MLKNIQQEPMTQTLAYLNPQHASNFDYEEQVRKYCLYFMRSADRDKPEEPNEYEKKLFKEIIINEQKYSDYYVFYHGSVGRSGYENKPGPGVLIDFYTELNRWFNINEYSKLIMFRLLDVNGITQIYDESFSSVDEFLSNFYVKELRSAYNYNGNKFDADYYLLPHLLPVNMSLFGRMSSAHKQIRIEKDKWSHGSAGEFTLNFFFGNFSMEPPNYREILTNIFKSFDFEEKYLDEILLTYDKYMKNTGGHLYQIFIKKDSVDSFAYLARPGGAPLQDISEWIRDDYRGSLKNLFGLKGNFSELFKQINTEKMKNISSFLSGYVGDKNFINYYSDKYVYFDRNQEQPLPWFDHLQARLVMLPSLFTNESKVKIFRYYSAEPVDEVGYKQAMNNIFQKMLKEWIVRQLKSKPSESIKSNEIKSQNLHKLLRFMEEF